MSFLGKEIRMKRLLNQKSGKLLAITVDHSIARGIQGGLIRIQQTIDKIIEGEPDAITMHKGIADLCFRQHAGKVALIVKCSSFSPFQPGFDTWVTDIEEVVRLGGDAASMGCILGGPEQPEQLRQLGLMAKSAATFGIPLAAHIYPRGSYIEKKDQYDWKNVAYAVRAGAELGVDIIKTNYTGSPETFVKVIDACPARVVIAGGEVGKTIEDYLKMTKDVMEIGAAGVTYGRFVWEYPHIPELIRVLKFIIHENGSYKEAVELLHDLVGSKK